jgi:hypothetical protein
MKRLSVLAAALGFLVAGCGSTSTSPTTTTPTKPTFTAALSPANEVPAIVGAEASGTGTATITFDVTKDAAGNITAGTATFVVNLSGFPAGTPINIAHIHQAGAGAPGSVVFSTTLSAADAVTLTNGSGSFTKAAIAPSDVAIFQAIVNNPAGFYFNVHSQANPNGVARGQLVKVS